jgi:hypothetical protein
MVIIVEFKNKKLKESFIEQFKIHERNMVFNSGSILGFTQIEREHYLHIFGNKDVLKVYRSEYSYSVDWLPESRDKEWLESRWSFYEKNGRFA